MVIDEKLQMYILYKEFSSRFCALDFRGMVCEQLDVNAKETPGLLLKVDSHRKDYIAFLQEHNYPELIANMLMYCELTDNLKDACKPFISDEEFEHIRKEFGIAQAHLSYTWREDGLLFRAPMFFVDIVALPLSQFHHEIINTMDVFQVCDDRFKDLNVFLDARTPSFYTQFSQYWVAEKLGKLDVGSNLMVPCKL
jgi:hypothetical protein